MIAALDVPTLAFLSALVFLSVAVILLLVFVTRRVYPGFGYWVLWQLSATAGVLIFAQRGADPSPALMLLMHALLLAAPALFFHGLARFYDLHASPAPVLAGYGIAAVAFAGQAYFTLADPDIDTRIVIYSVTRAALLARCAIEPLRAAAARRSPSFWTLVVLLTMIVCNDLYHAWTALGPGGAADLADSDSIRRALVAAVVAGVLAAYILVLLNSERLEGELRTAHRDIELLARTDSLTGLWNRRHFEDTLQSEIERARRYDAPLSLIALDADHFKRVNDRYGHHAGDEVLCDVARLLAEQIRRSDVLCRWGGEEFMILVPETDIAQVAAMAEKIRRHVAAHDFRHVDRMTVSIGIGQLTAGETADGWLRRVDTALYEAKQRGRDRVAAAPVETAA